VAGQDTPIFPPDRKAAQMAATALPTIRTFRVLVPAAASAAPAVATWPRTAALPAPVPICIGCAECTVACRFEAIAVNWKSDLKLMQEKMAEYALAVVQEKKDKCAFFNLIINVTPDCDCCNFSDVPIVPDIGIVVSKDPVAVDQAADVAVHFLDVFATRFEAGIGGGQDRAFGHGIQISAATRRVKLR